MKLYGYYRSSTSYRLRIALELKGLAYDYVPVNLLEAEQRGDAFRQRNPFAGVPVLEADGRSRAQSMALLEWLDEASPASPLLPDSVEDRYTARALASAIATELHAPLNLPVLQFLKKEFGRSQEDVEQWYRHWLTKTLAPLEQHLEQLGTGSFLFARPGYFECVLIPQMYNARRFDFDFSAMPRMVQIETACLKLPEFQRAHPDNQPDNPERKAHETRDDQ